MEPPPQKIHVYLRHCNFKPGSTSWASQAGPWRRKQISSVVNKLFIKIFEGGRSIMSSNLSEDLSVTIILDYTQITYCVIILNIHSHWRPLCRKWFLKKRKKKLKCMWLIDYKSWPVLVTQLRFQFWLHFQIRSLTHENSSSMNQRENTFSVLHISDFTPRCWPSSTRLYDTTLSTWWSAENTH